MALPHDGTPEKAPGFTFYPGPAPNGEPAPDALAAHYVTPRVPKLYEYFGLVVFFYSDDHLPIHVHGRHGDRMSKAEIVVEDGGVVAINVRPAPPYRPLEGTALADFETLVTRRASEIVEKWTAYFVLNQRVHPERITRRLR